MEKTFISGLSLTLLSCVQGMNYYCSDQRGLEDVFSNFNPLCDGTQDCSDGSDEAFCHDSSYTGCWSVNKGFNGNDSTIMDCSECICIADVLECSKDEFLDKNCHYCITDASRINDGIRDCIHGIDESANAKTVKASLPNWREIMRESQWRCKDPFNDNMIKRCGAVLSEHRQPFLYSYNASFDHDCNALEAQGFDFWRCSTGQCVRDKNHCIGQCPAGFAFDVHQGKCILIKCSQGARRCENSCLDRREPCNGECYYTSHYFCPMMGTCIPQNQPCGPLNTCPKGFLYCTFSGTCISVIEPCGTECLDQRRLYCMSSNTCLLPNQPCSRRCYPGEFFCVDQCQSISIPCRGFCAKEVLWPCKNICIKKTEPCEDRCDLGMKLCGPACINYDQNCYYDETTTTTTSTPLIPRNTVFSSTTTVTELYPWDPSASGRSFSHSMHDGIDFFPTDCSQQICLEDIRCNPDSEPCLEHCIPVNATCHRKCLHGRILCKSVNHGDWCPLEEEFSKVCIDTSPLSLTVSNKVAIAVIGVNCLVLLITVIIFIVWVLHKKKRKEALRKKSSPRAYLGGFEDNSSTYNFQNHTLDEIMAENRASNHQNAQSNGFFLTFDNQ